MGKEGIARDVMFHMQPRAICVANKKNGDVYADVPSDVFSLNLVQKVNENENLLVNGCVERWGDGGVMIADRKVGVIR